MPQLSNTNWTTLLFGNGLGLALDNNYFRLEMALHHAWNESDSGSLNNDDKSRIALCIGEESIEYAPTSEEHLELLQRVVAACDFLDSVADREIGWLSDSGRRFPDSVRKYLGRAAAYFHDYEGSLPDTFLDPLCDFINSNDVHVATLNYDDLLYGPFVDREICKNYQGHLVDGFLRDGFDPANLKRTFSHFGWYLHLHGSPLFAEHADGRVSKLRRCDLPSNHGLRKHLVLTHHRYKPGLIQHSRVLRAYYECFREALAESSRLICIGYSGCDPHVNYAVQQRLKNASMQVHIVEWEGAPQYSLRKDRKQYWYEQFHVEKPTIDRLPNILHFDFSTVGQEQMPPRGPEE